MKFNVISCQELDVGLQTAWTHLLQGAPTYQSPYYHPTYSLLVGESRPDTRILVMEDAGAVCGFLPFHHKSSLVAEVVGGGLTDYQGPVLAPRMQMPLTAALRAMRVCYMGFNHMPSERVEFSPFAWEYSKSLTLNLEGGFAAYAQRLQETRDASLLKKIETSERKLAKKIGPLRFCFDTHQPEEFAALLKGKSDQFIRTLGPAHDAFAIPWIRSTVEAIHHANASDFAGVLSTLYAGDTLIAAHFGMRSATTLHYWFPWYETAFAEFSPGLILLASCAREAALTGVNLIDLGRGEQPYKLRFATGHIDLCEGAVSSPAIISRTQASYSQLRQGLKNSSMGNYLRQLKNRLK